LENADSVSVVFYDGEGEIEACGVIEELTGEAEEWAESIFAEKAGDSEGEEETAADSVGAEDDSGEGDSDNMLQLLVTTHPGRTSCCLLYPSVFLLCSVPFLCMLEDIKYWGLV